ncbi:MAG: ATP-binding protein [Synergistaceae bacterium]|nr:ATP-binding protein [Synergistaceae bacterium]
MNSETNNICNDFPQLSRKISRLVGKAIYDFSMIEENDKILIGFSGGKDSFILTLALRTLQARSPIKFKLGACYINQSNLTQELSDIQTFLAKLNIPLITRFHPTFQIITERKEKSPCSLCANFRRGLLATAASECGYNKIALGHHKDDVVQTVLLNLLHTGNFKCFEPSLFMTKSKITVIRPLVYVEERNILLESERLNLPILQSSCPFGSHTQRNEAQEIIEYLEAKHTDVKSNILHALIKSQWKQST